MTRIEFEAVFHTAEVFVNGRKAGEHAGKGYTAFAFDISGLLAFGAANAVAVRVDNAFAPAMLPRSGLLRLDAGRGHHPTGAPPRDVRRSTSRHLWVDAVARCRRRDRPSST
ncbi:MAG: hypothetical protein M0C28_07180 [Candidatus Moduliflexus flocculans]|nr:hypothetical protein [Candidatus Moduliflexus flocculans]